MRATMLLVLGMASAASAAESPVTPGRWQTTTMIESMAMPGMPPDMAKRMMGKPMSATICISPKDATAGPRDLIGKSNGACRYRSFAAAAGRINAVMACKAGGEGPQVIAISGTYSPVADDIRAKMSGGVMRAMSRAVGKRRGPC